MARAGNLIIRINDAYFIEIDKRGNHSAYVKRSTSHSRAITDTRTVLIGHYGSVEKALAAIARDNRLTLKDGEKNIFADSVDRYIEHVMECDKKLLDDLSDVSSRIDKVISPGEADRPTTEDIFDEDNL